MSLKVIDKTGRLPKNPKDWPAELRRAIAECCCGDSSSSSSDVQPYSLDCCPATNFNALCVTIAGGSAYDGTFRLTYQEQQQVTHSVVPGGLGGGCNTLLDEYADGWFSDWRTDCRSVCPFPPPFGVSSPALRHRIWVPKNPLTGKATCSIRHVTESRFASFPPGAACHGELQMENGALFIYQTHHTAIGCDPLVITYRNFIMNCGCNATLGGDGFPVQTDAIMTEC